MQRSFYLSKLYIRLIISLFLSISASFLFISITNYRSHSSRFIDRSREIADRILLIIRTSENCQSRLKYLLQSWISTDYSKQSNIYLTTDNISNQTNSSIWNSFRHVIQTNCPTTHNIFDLCCKTAHEFELFYKLFSTTRSDLQWMCRFDDDQYINLDNLYQYISQFNSSKPYYIGRTSVPKGVKVSNTNRTYQFATYGAGVCYSRALLQLLHPHVVLETFPKNCKLRSRPDDAYMGYLSEIILNVSLTSMNDLFHSHLEILDKSFRKFSLYDLTRMITFGFAWDRYKLNWLPIIHQLIKLVHQDQHDAANRLWLFLRNYEKEHPENLTDQYDQSCISYQQIRNQTRLLKMKTTIPPKEKTLKKQI
ncbi:hypothetical protein I4U23_010224 [Adineta vaga]|nr:hypothetical protein I4U23_010224 [Adineta vaga]